MTTYCVLRMKLNTKSNQEVLKILNTYWRKLGNVINFDESDIIIEGFDDKDYENAHTFMYYNAEDFCHVNYLCLKHPYQLRLDENRVYYFEYILAETDYDGVDDAYSTLSNLEDGKTILNALKYLNDIYSDIDIVVYNDFGNEYIIQVDKDK